MDVAKKLRVNPELANKGKWVPFMEDVELLIASASSPSYRATRRRLFQDARAKLRSGGDAAAEATEEIALKLLATEVLRGWKNITEDGKPLAYSPEVALKLLRDYPPIANFVDSMGDDIKIFQLDEDDRGLTKALQWRHTWGAQERWLRKRQAAGNRVVALDNKPEVPEWLDDYWQGFQVLDACRSYGFSGAQPLDIKAIIAWMDESAIVASWEREVFINVMLMLDGEQLTMQANDRKSKETAALTMEFAELIVKITGEGIDAVTRQLEAFTAETTAAGGAIDITGDKTKAYAVKLNELLGVINTFKRAHKLMEDEKVKDAKTAQDKMDKLHQEAIEDERRMQAQRKLIYSARMLLYKMDTDAQQRALAAMEKMHEEALAMDRARTASIKKVTDANEAAAKRVAGRPATAAVGRLFGAVGSGDIKEVAQQVDMFRSKMFDFLVVWGSAKAVLSIVDKFIVEPVKLAVGASIEFERQWAIVMRTVTGSGEELAAVRSGLRDLMADRPFDPQEITDAVRALGELGVGTKEILKATDYITRFSAASGIATDEAATLFGQILATEGVLHPTANQIGELASSALELGTSFAIGNKAVLTTMLRVSALIPTFHLTEDAALGLSTAMGSLGIKAERGTSALQLLFSMARNADPDKLARFANIIQKTSKETEALIKNDIGEFTLEFARGMKEMSDVGANTDKLLQDLGIRTVRARQAFGQLAGGVDTLAEAMDVAEASAGSLDELMEQSDRQLHTTDASIKTLGNSIWVLAGSITEGVLEPLNEFVTLLHDLVETARMLPVGLFTTSGFEMAGGAGTDASGMQRSAAYLKVLEAQQAYQESGGIEGASPLLRRKKTEVQKILDQTNAQIDKATSYWDDEPVPFLDPQRLGEAVLEEGRAATKAAKKVHEDLQNQYDSDYKKSLNAAEKYAAKMADVAKMEQEGVGTPEGRAKIAADAKDELNEANERAAKSSEKLSKEQKRINDLIKEARTPMEVYYDLEKELNDLVENHSLPAKVRDVLLEKELKEAKEKTNKERDKELEKQKKLDDELTKYAVSLNPVVELEQKIAKVREAMAKRPGIVTKQVGEEEIARLIREVKLPEEWEKTMRIVEGITERGMNAVADTMTDALWDGATKGKEIMRSFAKDITNILLEELAFKPISEGIIDMVKKDQVAKYLGSIKEGMPGQTTPGTESAEELTKAADQTTKSFNELGEGAIKLFLDLTSGIGGFLAGLLGGGGGGFDFGELFLRMGIGGAAAGVSTYAKGLLPSTTTNDFDQTFTGPGADQLPGYTTGSYASSRASTMDYSAGMTMSATHGQAPPVNITMTALDPQTAASVIMSNMPIIERGMQRAVDRGSAYAKAHGRRR